MIVWGGRDTNSNAKNTGARFSPSSNSWIQISTAGAPSARWGHTAIWTGTEMIIWGGFSGTPNFLAIGDGAKYNPQTDSWTPLPAVNQPAARVYHSAVWTGSEMIVWGGFSCLACANAELATGARYRPASDDWVATAASANATARANHTAIWTGSRMIIWGGENASSVVGTGAAYDPVADDWALTTATDAPSARRCHAAVWTGNEMILFGGQLDTGLGCGISTVGTGARFVPASDTWNAMATAPVSSSMAGAAAVWTGSRLITWLDTAGARYDPVANTWSGMTATGAPSARRSHTLVWTGSRLVVWGGEFAGPLSTGGIYDPSVDTTP
jgi:N-acetylneuraminic acid mutarotase